MVGLRRVLRRLWALVVCVLPLWLFGVPAGGLAADLAEYRMLGYSVDARFFAFEQFGIQDGSGFAYSEIFILDVENDRWVPGTPVRMRGIDETERLYDVRAEAMARAEQHLARLHISAAFRTLAATTPMEQGTQETELSFNPRPILNPIDPLHTLTLTTLPMDSQRDCFGMVETAGFELAMSVEGQGTTILHRDERLPVSRFCPSRYGLAAVVTPFDTWGAFDERRAVALISVYQLGFEGLDRRFLAVPFDLPL